MNSVVRDDAPDLGKAKLSMPFLLRVVAFVAAAFVTWGAMSSRIAVIETKQSESDRRQGDADRRMERIEDKLDTLLRRIP